MSWNQLIATSIFIKNILVAMSSFPEIKISYFRSFSISQTLHVSGTEVHQKSMLSYLFLTALFPTNLLLHSLFTAKSPTIYYCITYFLLLHSQMFTAASPTIYCCIPYFLLLHPPQFITAFLIFTARCIPNNLLLHYLFL